VDTNRGIQSSWGTAAARLAGVVVAVTALVAGLLASSATPASASTSVEDLERQVVALHDRARADAGLAPLTVLPLFTAEAREWSQTMGESGWLRHQTADSGAGSYADTTCRASGLAWTWCGENVAAGQSTAAAVHDAWMASPGHRAAIMRPDATVVGVGAWRDASGRVWWTARFMAAPDIKASAGTTVSADAMGDYVDATYRVFTGRAATSSERSWWVDALSAGHPRSALVQALSTSDAWLGAEIDEIYELALGRTPDPSGRDHWTRSVRSGMRITDLGVFVFASDEFFSVLGSRPDRFVDEVHRRILGRPARASEVLVATSRMVTGTPRSAIVADVYRSLESRTQRVEGLYRDVLGRGADDAGRGYWADVLLVHDDVRLASFLAGSDEFFQVAIS